MQAELYTVSGSAQRSHGRRTTASSPLLLGEPLSLTIVGAGEKEKFFGEKKGTPEEHDCEPSTAGRESDSKSPSPISRVRFCTDCPGESYLQSLSEFTRTELAGCYPGSWAAVNGRSPASTALVKGFTVTQQYFPSRPLRLHGPKWMRKPVSEPVCPHGPRLWSGLMPRHTARWHSPLRPGHRGCLAPEGWQTRGVSAESRCAGAQGRGAAGGRARAVRGGGR